MAIYKQLHLPSGGGVISYNQQADQVKNRATILIGLGGTGIDCIRTIKEQVYKRLKPDDENALIPNYQHIEFLGVDADDKSAEFLDPGDFFDISYNGSLSDLLKDNAAIDSGEEFDWLRNDQIQGADLGGAGAGGVRQVGRLLLMRNAKEFALKLQQKINNAKMDLVNPDVHVHIIAGISGGTGSGSFLDICYIVRDILSAEQNANIFGYIFLPDVNISKGLDKATQEDVKKNGYACLQEIDYCMSLDKNGGAFKQVYYPGKRIDWNQPPVDMCHLLSATNSAGEVILQPYQYAMNVVSGYIMDFLTHSDDDRFSVIRSLSTFHPRVIHKSTTKIRGYNLEYCGLGAACATLPLMEINTYLASQLFNEFVNLSQAHKPTEADVDQLAIDIFAPGAKTRGELYTRILVEVKNGDPSVDFDFYEGDYRDLLLNDNGPFIKHYADQRAIKLGAVKTNVERLKDDKNKESYLARMHRSLQGIICGDDKHLAKGAAFAKDLLDRSKSYSLFNIIEGLRRENKEREKHEVYNYGENHYPTYHRSEKVFLGRYNRRFFDNDMRRFIDYENAARNVLRSSFDIEVYKEIEDLLDTFENQVKASLENFYQILERVLGNLNATFKENADYLAEYDQSVSMDPFYMQMVTIKDLQESMDAEVRKLYLPKVFQNFLQGMYEHIDDWIEEDERKISRLVTDFLTKDVFFGYANRNITTFLRDKYNDPEPQELVQHIYNDYIQRIAAKANPLFPIDATVQNIHNVGMRSHFSIPIVSVEILQAAKKYAADITSAANPICVNPNNQTDRIYMIRNAFAFPLGSYTKLNEYEISYFNSIDGHYGRHLYEGERPGKEGKISHMKFNDWRELPPLRPRSNIIINDYTPREMARIITESEELYDRGMELGVIGKMSNNNSIPHDDNIYTIDEKVMQDLEEMMQILEKALAVSGQASISDVKTLIPKIESLLNTPLTPTGVTLFRDGFEEIQDQERIRRDYFISMPVKYGIIREGIQRLEKMDKYRKRLEDCQSKIQEYEM